MNQFSLAFLLLLIALPFLSAESCGSDGFYYCKTISDRVLFEYPSHFVEVSLRENSVVQNIPIGFDFKFYDGSYDSLTISSNGFVTFTKTNDSGAVFTSIPSPLPPNNFVAVLWMDYSKGHIMHETRGIAPHRRSIITWKRMNLKECENEDNECPSTFQLKLFESTNQMEIHYREVPQSGHKVAGVENINGNQGIEFFRSEGPISVRAMSIQPTIRKYLSTQPRSVGNKVVNRGVNYTGVLVDDPLSGAAGVRAFLAFVLLLLAFV